MAKQTSLFGKISGKLGAVVFATSGGKTISREYNPNVANPSTLAQVNQRARLKLMAQLSASLAPVIAIPKDGLISARNQFVKKNFSQSYANNGTAQVTYENLQITNGNAGLPSIVATRSQESGITIQLAENADAAVSRVVYIMYRKTSEQTLQLVQSIIVEGAGANGTFAGSMLYTEGDLIFYAYGMKDLSANATANYGNLQVANAVDVARLLTTRNVANADYQYTETRGATMYADENEIADVPEGSARIFVTAFGGGKVTGGGVKVIGDNCTVVATANDGYTFIKWVRNGESTTLSTEPEYTFRVEGTTDLVAIFNANVSPTSYLVRAQVSSSLQTSGAKVKIGSTEAVYANSEVNIGDSVTVEAIDPTEGYDWDGWYQNINGASTKVSSAKQYTFIPNSNVTVIAVWTANSPL